MITQVQLGNNILTTPSIFVTAFRNGAFPGVAYTRTKRGGFQGSHLVTPTFVGYKISLEWQIIGSSFSDFATQRENFVNALGLIHSLGSQRLYITKSNGVQVFLDIKAIDATGDLDTENILNGAFQTDLEGEYPFFQSSILQTQDVYILNGGGWAAPFAIPMDMSAGSTNTVSVRNFGNYAAYPILTFVGPLTNPVLTNVSTGKQLSLNYTLSSTSVSLVVDTYERTVTIQPAGTNGRQYASGDFLTVQPGSNVLQLGNANTTDAGKCTVTFRDTYLGI